MYIFTPVISSFEYAGWMLVVFLYAVLTVIVAILLSPFDAIKLMEAVNSWRQSFRKIESGF